MPDSATGRVWQAIGSRQLRGIVWGLCAALIWGGYLAFARAGVLAGIDAFDIAFLRFAVAGLCLAPWFLVGRAAPRGARDWRRSLVLVCLVGPPFVLLGVGGFAYAPLAHGALLQPAVLMLGSLALAALLLHERPSAGDLIAVVAILVGLGLLVGAALAQPSGLLLLGDAMFAVSALMWALFATLQRLWQIDALQAVARVSVLSALLVVPAYLLARGPGGLLALPTDLLVSQLVVHGLLVGIVAIVAFTKSVALLGAPQAACFPALVPGVAMVVGMPVAGELPSAAQWIGLAVVTGGLLLRSAPTLARPYTIGRERRP